MKQRTYDAVVVGAGPGGSAAATTLATRGWAVLLLEKDEFPRDKVCGEFLSSEARGALDRLGVSEEIARLPPERIQKGSVHPAGRAGVSFELPAPALGVSRRALDTILARRSAAAGAEVRFRERVVAVEGDLSSGFRLRTSGPTGEALVSARAVVGAWGRWNALDRALDRTFLSRRASYVGWSRDFVGDTEFLSGQVRLYLFPGGYCGLSRVEGGEVNLAGVISEEIYKRIGGGWEAVLAHARRANPSLGADLDRLRSGPRGFLGVGPVYFTAKPPVESGILMVGDAAGVIDPFSGQGQSSALHSGLLAAEACDAFLAGAFTSSDLPAAYARRWRDAFGTGFAWSAAFREILLRPRLSRLVSRIAGRRLVALAMGKVVGGGS